jgi:integrin alpha FG-GAP repeat containing protein 1
MLTAYTQPSGASTSGVSYKYTILDTSGRRSAAHVPQLPQTSYQALCTPYAFFGLGRTNNYIENLFAGAAHGRVAALEMVIPNSKLVINPGTTPDEWHKELYLRPGQWIPWVGVTVLGTMVALAGVVLVLHLNEKVRSFCSPRCFGLCCHVAHRFVSILGDEFLAGGRNGAAARIASY